MRDDKCNARGCNSVAQNGNVNAGTAISPVNARYVPDAVVAFAASALPPMLQRPEEFGDLLFPQDRT